MDKAEAAKKIDSLVKEAHKCINEAEAIAIEHNLEFSFGVARGMGGCFVQWDDDYMEEGIFESKGDYPRWVSSSEQC